MYTQIEKDEVLEQALKTKRIDLDKNIVLYDANGKDALVVADYLSKKDINIYINMILNNGQTTKIFNGKI